MLVEDDESAHEGGDVDSTVAVVDEAIEVEEEGNDELSCKGRETQPPSRCKLIRKVACSMAPSTQMFSNRIAGGLTAKMDALICARRSSMSRCWDAAMVISMRATEAQHRIGKVYLNGVGEALRPGRLLS